MWEELVIIVILVCVAIALWSKVNREGNEGNLLGKMLPKRPRYYNKQTGIIGRLAGDPKDAIKTRSATTSDITYKTGMFGTKKDPDIPNWAITRRDPPNTETPEGIYEIQPYKVTSQFTTQNEKLIMELHYHEELNKVYLSQITRLNQQILGGVNATVLQDSMKNIAKLIKDTEKRLYGTKEIADEAPLLRMEEKTQHRKPISG